MTARRTLGRWAAAVLAAALLAGGPPATAGARSGSPARESSAPAGRERAAAPDARAVFDAVARAWQAEDHAALADRVAAEGVDIAVNLATGARNHYSARQAFYFFKNLFQTTETTAFRFTLLQDNEGDGGPVHALADWSYRRAADGDPVAERLVFSLSHGARGWALVSIRAMR